MVLTGFGCGLFVTFLLCFCFSISPIEIMYAMAYITKLGIRITRNIWIERTQPRTKCGRSEDGWIWTARSPGVPQGRRSRALGCGSPGVPQGRKSQTLDYGAEIDDMVNECTRAVLDIKAKLTRFSYCQIMYYMKLTTLSSCLTDDVASS